MFKELLDESQFASMAEGKEKDKEEEAAITKYISVEKVTYRKQKKRAMSLKKDYIYTNLKAPSKTLLPEKWEEGVGHLFPGFDEGKEPVGPKKVETDVKQLTEHEQWMSFAVMGVVLCCVFTSTLGLGVLHGIYYTADTQGECETDPPEPIEGSMVRRWSGSRIAGTKAVYLCRDWGGTPIQSILQCSPKLMAWVSVFSNPCSCRSTPHPGAGFVYRHFHENMNFSFGANITYFCSRDRNSPIASIVQCDNYHYWTNIETRSCECRVEGKQTIRILNGIELQGNRRIMPIGAFYQKECMKDDLSVRTTSWEICNYDGKPLVINERNCECFEEPPEPISALHHKGLHLGDPTRSAVGNLWYYFCHKDFTYRHYKSVVCTTNGTWATTYEEIPEKVCTFHFIFLNDTRRTFQECKERCQALSGYLVAMKSFYNRLHLLNLMKDPKYNCKGFFLGIKEDPDARLETLSRHSIAWNVFEKLWLPGYPLERVGHYIYLDRATKKLMNLRENDPHCYICLDYADCNITRDDCLEIVHTFLSAEEAINDCMTRAKVHFEMKSLEYYEVLKSKIENLPATDIKQNLCQKYFVGVRLQERIFRNVLNERVTFDMWGPHEPSNYEHQCVTFRNETNFESWTLTSCEEKFCGICVTMGGKLNIQ